MRRGVRILLGILALLLAATGAAALWARPVPAHPFFERFSHHPLIIAHQGGDGLWPGDTLFALQNAASLGVDMLEMDAHMSADGIIVLMHDATVDRTTDGAGAIREMTLAELKQLDAGYDWSPDGETSTPFRGQGIVIPTLAEVFETFPGMPMNIEIKQADPPMADPLCQLIRQYNKQDEVLIASFRDEAMAAFRQACPEVATSTAEGETKQFVYLHLAGLGRFFRPEGQAVQVPIERSGITILTPRFVRAAHGRHLRVDAWTINDLEEMQQMIDLGVDGIITDRPDRLIDLLGSRP